MPQLLLPLALLLQLLIPQLPLRMLPRTPLRLPVAPPTRLLTLLSALPAKPRSKFFRTLQKSHPWVAFFMAKLNLPVFEVSCVYDMAGKHGKRDFQI